MPVFGFVKRWRMRGSNPRPSPCKGEKGESPAVPLGTSASLPDAGNAPTTPTAAGATTTPQGTPVAALSAALSAPDDDPLPRLLAELDRYRRARAGLHQGGAW